MNDQHQKNTRQDTSLPKMNEAMEGRNTINRNVPCSGDKLDYPSRRPQNDTKKDTVGIGDIMEHLQTALDKIEHLESEVKSLKEKELPEEKITAKRVRLIEPDDRGQQLPVTYYDHECRTNRPSTKGDPADGKDEASKKRHSSHATRSRNITTGYWRAPRESRGQVRSGTNTSDEIIVGSLRHPSQKTDGDTSDGDSDISMYRDEESGGEKNIVDDLASAGEFSNIFLSRNLKSNTEVVNSPTLEFDREIKKNHRHNCLSIGELRKEYGIKIKEQAATIEELRALVTITSNDGDYHPPRIGQETSGPAYKTQSRRGLTMFVRTPSVLMDSDLTTSLDEDTFSLMMITRVGSKSWSLGGTSFCFQMILGINIAVEQFRTEEGKFIIDVPFENPHPFFRVAQVLIIIICLSTQTDILTSIRSFFLWGGQSNWRQIIGREGTQHFYDCWMLRIGLPNALKFSQGIVVTIVSCVIIVENIEVITLLKDFTSLMVISEFDNILYQLAAYGYLGEELRLETVKVSDTKVTTSRSSTARHHIIFVRLAFLALLSGMLALWVYVYHMQRNGLIFERKFPECGDHNHTLFALQKFGDGECYGGPFNTLACKYENGDCNNFNTEYPNCNGENHIDLINVETEVGDEDCNLSFAIMECEYDGGDCCPYDIHTNPLFGDGNCDGGLFLTEGCQYDNKDCDAFVKLYPNCSIEELSKQETSIHTKLGNGICEGAGYNVEECGFEFRDCDEGQIGGDLLFYGVLSPITRKFDFSVKTSTDCSKILVNMPHTSSLGNYDVKSDGKMAGYYYDSNSTSWVPVQVKGIGNGTEHAVISGNGNTIAVGLPEYDDFNGRVEIFDFYKEFPTHILSAPHKSHRPGFGSKLALTDDGLRIAISSPFHSDKDGRIIHAGMIQILERKNAKQELWTPIGNDIYGTATGEIIGHSFLAIDSLNGTRVFYSSYAVDHLLLLYRARHFDERSQEWAQLGSEITRTGALNSSTDQKVAETISADGSTFALSLYSENEQNEIKIYKWDMDQDSSNRTGWNQVESTTLGSMSRVGHDISMNTNGTLLVSSKVDPSCDGAHSYESDSNSGKELCNTGSIELYQYNSADQKYSQLLINYRSFAKELKQVQDDIILGLEVSLSGDGSKLSVSGYNIDQGFGFVKVYNVSELFHIECIVEKPELVGDGVCDGYWPYSTEKCGWDGGDCPPSSFVSGYDNCEVTYPHLIGDGNCDNNLPYNSEQCRFDGGDCPAPSSPPS